MAFWSPDVRVRAISIDADVLSVGLMDGRTISVALPWYPRLLAGARAPRGSEGWRSEIK